MLNCSRWSPANALFRDGRRVLATHRQEVLNLRHSTFEHQKSYCHQDGHSLPSCHTVLFFIGNSLHLCGEVSFHELSSCWVFVKQKAWPWLHLSISDWNRTYSTNLHLHKRLDEVAWILMDIREWTSTKLLRHEYKYPTFQHFSIFISITPKMLVFSSLATERQVPILTLHLLVST